MSRSRVTVAVRRRRLIEEYLKITTKCEKLHNDALETMNWTSASTFYTSTVHHYLSTASSVAAVVRLTIVDAGVNLGSWTIQREVMRTKIRWISWTDRRITYYANPSLLTCRSTASDWMIVGGVVLNKLSFPKLFTHKWSFFLLCSHLIVINRHELWSVRMIDWSEVCTWWWWCCCWSSHNKRN